MIGSYVLLIELTDEQFIQIGKLGRIHFSASWYVYVGSAMNGITSRVNRHFSDQKKHHWHIDYLLDHAVLHKSYVKESTLKEECEIASVFASRFSFIPHFGSSDCKCESHLFHGEKNELEKTILEAGLKEFMQK